MMKTNGPSSACCMVDERDKTNYTFPRFEKSAYIPVGRYEDFEHHRADEARRMIWYHTGISTPWWAEKAAPVNTQPLYAKRLRRNVPQGTVALEECASVHDANGYRVGKVLNVYAVSLDHRLTHIF